MRKVVVFTGTRADYGLLYWLMKGLKDDENIELQIIVSGTHLSSEFGNTVDVIVDDGFFISEKVDTLLSSDNPSGILKGMGLGLIGYGDALNRLKPDVLVLLGDRSEAFAMAQAALIYRVPILHLHGGEVTEGAYDDAFRHAITKLSYLHCTSTEYYRNRVIQLGEAPERVHNVGAMGLEHIRRSSLMSLAELSESLDFEIKSPYFLVTYHPVTLSDIDPSVSFSKLLNSLNQFPENQIIFTYPNADDGGRKIIKLLDEYQEKFKGRVLCVKSLGQARYLSAVKNSEMVIGNSSSGLIEAPSLKVPTVNIGYRQKGRLRASSVIDCECNENDIVNSINKANSIRLSNDSSVYINPYDSGDASKKVIKLIHECDFSTKKIFHDLGLFT